MVAVGRRSDGEAVALCPNVERAVPVKREGVGLVGRQAALAGEVAPLAVNIAEQSGFGGSPDAAVFGADRQRKDAGAERAGEGAVGAPCLAVEDGNAVIERAGPEASGFVYGQRIGVVVAEAVGLCVVGILLAGR